jgi:hypothetical protein
VAAEADYITTDTEITELDRRDVSVVRFNPADIGENLAVSALFGTCPLSVAPPARCPASLPGRRTPPGTRHPPKSVLESVQGQASIRVR